MGKIVDIRTGQRYETFDGARQAGVPASDIALVEETADGPIVTFKNGPFKNRTYRKTQHGLVRVDRITVKA